MSSTDDFPRTVDQARTDIELTRAELAETAEALAYKLNVPERAKERLQQSGSTALEQLRHNPIPLVVGGVVVALVVSIVIAWRPKR